LFNEKALFFKLSRGLTLPGNIEQILEATARRLKSGDISHEDSTPLLYLKLRLEGSDQFSHIRQVVIDEVQDYLPLHYEVFNLLFKGANYTVLGDISQSVETAADISFYDEVEKTLGRKRSIKFVLSKSFRSSFEISSFAKKIAGGNPDVIPFERHEAEPAVICGDTQEDLDRAIAGDAGFFLEQGYESVAIICKTAAEAQKLYAGLKDSTWARLVSSGDEEMERGIAVIPSYIAKGLEFDVVLVYNVSAENYSTDFDARLLYIACTRALHRLKLYYCGEKSPLLPL
jgi:DNA helicase-2/ATP-dependent DNA helicase PcrA